MDQIKKKELNIIRYKGIVVKSNISVLSSIQIKKGSVHNYKSPTLMYL